MQDLSDITVVLPSLDPDDKLNAVIDGLLQYGFQDIILVNDGSRPENLHYFEDAARLHPEINVLHHEVNKGMGAALKNAFRWYLANRPHGKGVVTVDGDNQHHPEDTRACCERMLKTGHVILGCRDFSQKDVPARSSFGNKTTSAIFKIFCGITLSDTQTGLRAIPVQYLQPLIEVKGDRFEYETNMLLAMKDQGIVFEEQKIRTVYIEENKSSHFRVVRDSWRIYKLILSHFFRYTISSLVSAVVDVGAFSLLSHLTRGLLAGFALTAVPAVAARVISSLLNFYMNKRLVFQTEVHTGKALLRYYMLAVPMMIAQVLLTHGVFALLSISPSAEVLRSVIYTLVMILLFIVSYMVQQRWVFAPKKSN